MTGSDPVDIGPYELSASGYSFVFAGHLMASISFTDSDSRGVWYNDMIPKIEGSRVGTYSGFDGLKDRTGHRALLEN